MFCLQIAVLAALVAVAFAAPQQQRPFLQQAQYNQRQQIVSPSNNNRDVVYLIKETPHNNIGLEGYNFSFEQNDGQKREETAQAVQTRDSEGNPSVILRVIGSYSFVGADGITYTVNYEADENGYRASGAHLPVAPAA